MTQNRLYFRQLLAGRDFAVDNEIARQMVNFVYLVGDRENGEAMIIDPAYGVKELVEIAGIDGMKITGALATHYHPDHVGGSMMGWEIEGAAQLLALDGVEAKLHVQRDEAWGVKRMTGLSDSDLIEHDGGDVVTIGAIEVSLLHTPGHTPGSQCFLVDGCLLAGDTLFLDGCGRTDLPEETPMLSTKASHSALANSQMRPFYTRATCTHPILTPPWGRPEVQITYFGSQRSNSGGQCSVAEPST